MQSQAIQFIFSFSIFLAGIISLFKYNKISKAYYPFIFCIWLACCNELLSAIIITNHHRTSVNNNIYVIIEALLITLLFKNFGIFKKSKLLFYCVTLGLLFCWIIETFIINNITISDIYFRIIYSFVIVLMSITTINEIIFTGRKNNASFLLCIAFIIYFAFKVLVYAFWISNLSRDFLSSIFSIMIYINFLTNLIYAVAVLWMPRKLEFSLPY